MRAGAGFEADFAREVRERFPRCPEREVHRIARYACNRRTDRVGALSEAGSGYLAEAAELAVVAHLRHHYTSYEALLDRGIERDEARALVRSRVSELLRAWMGPRALPAD